MRPQRPNQNGYSSNHSQNHSGHPNSKNDDNAELRLKNRSYYQQMHDKYTVAARESLSLGERIEAECHFQRAEHYLRQLNDRIRYDNEAQQQQQQRLQAQQAQQAQQQARQAHTQQAQAQQAPAKHVQSDPLQGDNTQGDPSPIVVQPQKQPARVRNNERTHLADAPAHQPSVMPAEGEQGEPAPTQRPARKRVLRTPHRRHVPGDATASTQGESGHGEAAQGGHIGANDAGAPS